MGYRLSDEAIWPAQIHDVKAAIRFIRANADRYGIDPQKIGLIGPSAGGHLVLMLGTSGDVPELEGELGEHDEVSSRVTCVANLFGVAELGAMVGQESNIDRRRADSPEALLLGGLISENKEKARQASPVTWITPDDPPVLSVHGDVDRVVPYDQSVRLDKALEKEGVESYFVTVRGGGHGDFGDAAAEPLRQFFAKYLLGRDVEIPEAAIDKPEGSAAGTAARPATEAGAIESARCVLAARSIFASLRSPDSGPRGHGPLPTENHERMCAAASAPSSVSRARLGPIAPT